MLSWLKHLILNFKIELKKCPSCKHFKSSVIFDDAITSGRVVRLYNILSGRYCMHPYHKKLTESLNRLLTEEKSRE
jgi:hypothetical protein